MKYLVNRIVRLSFFVIFIISMVGCMGKVKSNAPAVSSVLVTPSIMQKVTYKNNTGLGPENSFLPLHYVSSNFALENKKFYASLHFNNRRGKVGQHAPKLSIYIVGYLDSSNHLKKVSSYMIRVNMRVSYSHMAIDNIILKRKGANQYQLSAGLRSRRILPQHRPIEAVSVKLTNIRFKKKKSVADLKLLDTDFNNDNLKRYYKEY